jgi:UDP-N-acetylmuramoyl-tripeptide--D-alanyl-D-alanine ligase
LEEKALLKLEVKEIARILKGNYSGNGENIWVENVSTDSRRIRPNSLFFALRGERFDGHMFLEEAIKNGARAAVISNKYKPQLEVNIPLIKVSDTLAALQKLAFYVRKKLDVKVVAITGSTGKTTTKDLLASILKQRFNVVVAPSNFNNEIGVPLTLLELNEHSKVAVLELAMRGTGEISELARLSQPEIGVVTNVGLTHYELLGSEEAIAKAKAELVENLPSRGWAVLNFDDPWFSFLKEKSRAKVISFGLRSESQVRGEEVRVDDEARASFKISFPKGSVNVKFPYPGKHYVHNALGAAAVAFLLGLKGEEIKEGVEKTQFKGMRMEVVKVGEVTLINDAYNANPTSMLAALEVLKDYRGGEKVACLGDMLELGEISSREHAQLGFVLTSIKPNLVVLLGKEVSATYEEALRNGFPGESIKMVQSHEEMAKIVLSFIKPGDVILFKGSRAMELEKVFEIVRGELSC